MNHSHEGYRLQIETSMNLTVKKITPYYKILN